MAKTGFTFSYKIFSFVNISVLCKIGKYSAEGVFVFVFGSVLPSKGVRESAEDVVVCVFLTVLVCVFVCVFVSVFVVSWLVYMS